MPGNVASSVAMRCSGVSWPANAASIGATAVASESSWRWARDDAVSARKSYWGSTASLAAWRAAAVWTADSNWIARGARTCSGAMLPTCRL